MMERVISDPKARGLLGGIGESIDLEDSIRTDMKTFVLSCIYDESANTAWWQARLSSGKKKKNK